MLTHGDRHLPCVQRPHTHCHSSTRSATHTPCLIHTYHATHTHGGHSPAVSHPHRGVRTHVPLPARTWLPPPAVPRSPTACREARTQAHSRPHHSHTASHPCAGSLPHMGAHSHTGALSHTRAHSYSGALLHTGAHTVFHSHTGFHPYTGTLSHTPLHSRHACAAARI